MVAVDALEECPQLLLCLVAEPHELLAASVLDLTRITCYGGEVEWW